MVRSSQAVLTCDWFCILRVQGHRFVHNTGYEQRSLVEFLKISVKLKRCT